jgi:hypothetical protein
MKISVQALSVDVFTSTARKFDSAVLVTSRLAPDMLPLSKQVQLACDLAKNSIGRLAGTEPPRFEDNEKTIEELRARIAKTIDYLKSVPAGSLEGSEDRDIKVPAGERTLEFKGLAFLQRWAIPNVLFHVVTAYNILRHNGVDIGKRDFLGGA